MEANDLHNANLMNEMDWLQKRIELVRNNPRWPEISKEVPDDCLQPRTLLSPSVYADFATEYATTVADRVLLLLALAPHIYPELLEKELTTATQPILAVLRGGVSGRMYKGFLPTGLTYLYLMAKNNPMERLKTMQYILHSPLMVSNTISFGAASPEEPLLSGVIFMHDIVLQSLLLNQPLSSGPYEEPAMTETATTES